MEVAENLTNMLLVSCWVSGVNEDIFEVHDDRDVKEIGEDAIHKPLEHGRCIGETKRHYTPLEGAIASAEGGLPLVAFSYIDEVVRMAEVNLCINACL